MKAGEAQAEMKYWKWVDQGIYMDDSTPDCSSEIAKLKNRRKQYLREALEEWEKERNIIEF